LGKPSCKTYVDDASSESPKMLKMGMQIAQDLAKKVICDKGMRDVVLFLFEGQTKQAFDNSFNTKS